MDKELNKMIDNTKCTDCKHSLVPNDVTCQCCNNHSEYEYRFNKQDDEVNHPSHYTSGSIECIDAMEAMLTDEEIRGYYKANVFKYLWRERHKGGTQSLEKALWYLDRLIKRDKNKE